MRVNREHFLGILESVSAGLSAKEVVEQSSCIVFYKDRIFTFNDEILCSAPFKFDGFEGAVVAKPLLDLLSKLKEDEIDISAENSEILVKGVGKRSGVRMEAKVNLPVDAVEKPDAWHTLGDDFSEAIGMVQPCASNDESQFVLTCIHFHPDYLEACDRFQIARFPVKTGLQEEILVRATSVMKISGLGMVEISETRSWLHFRNKNDLVFSCRKFQEQYPDLGRFLEKSECEKVTLPSGLEEIVSKAEIFTVENSLGNHVTVSIRNDTISVKGEGTSGWYEERKKIAYNADPLEFMIAPKLLLAISKKSNDCFISAGRLLVETGKFRLVMCTKVKEQAEV